MLIRSWHPSPSPPSPARRWLCTVYAQRTTTRPPETAIRLPVARNFLPWVRAFPRPPSQESLRFASPSVVQTLETWKVVGYQVLLNSSHVLNFFLSIVEILGRIKSRKNLLPRFDNSSKLWNRRANERKNEKFLSFVSPPFATGSPSPLSWQLTPLWQCLALCHCAYPRERTASPLLSRSRVFLSVSLSHPSRSLLLLSLPSPPSICSVFSSASKWNNNKRIQHFIFVRTDKQRCQASSFH